jgi:hypothetical protein
VLRLQDVASMHVQNQEVSGGAFSKKIIGSCVQLLEFIVSSGSATTIGVIVSLNDLAFYQHYIFVSRYMYLDVLYVSQVIVKEKLLVKAVVWSVVYAGVSMVGQVNSVVLG